MRALCWYGKHDVRVESVPDPKLLNPRDAIVRVTATAICGSDLHLYDGYIPTMEKGDILGHEFMGEVVEVGREVANLKVGDRVVVPFPISCGRCFFCKKGLTSLCDNSNPNAGMAEMMYGYSSAGIFGYSHLFGGYSGGQAEYVRVPYADFGPFKVPDGMEDEQVLFLTDILPTAFMAVDNCNIQPGDIVAIWGAGPVGMLAAHCAFVLGAERVVSIDHYPHRLRHVREKTGAEVINFDEQDVYETLRDLTGGRGPDACVDCVGLEAHGHGLGAIYDYAKAKMFLATDRPNALRQAINSCRKGGTVSVPGVYGGLLDKFPFGAAFSKALTFRMGQTHVHSYLPRLTELIAKGDIDPRFIITHRMNLDDAPGGYREFHDAQDSCFKIVLKP